MKLLVLHGYGQNGAIFRKKHAAVERRLTQQYPEATFVYPTAPIKLRSDDRPENDIDSSAIVANLAEDVVQDCIEPRGWCLLKTTRDVNPGLNESLDSIAHTLETQGPFDGIIAFSQGTYIAAMVISLLEGDRRRAAYEAKVAAMPNCFAYPESFRSIQHPPLKFGILYSGFMAQEPQFAWLFEQPRIQTPLLHFVGAVDPVLEDQWREAMHARVCGDAGARVVVHPGAHHVPTSRKHVEQIIPFVQEHMASAAVAAAATATASTTTPATRVEEEEEKKKTPQPIAPLRREDSVIDLATLSLDAAKLAQTMQPSALVSRAGARPALSLSKSSRESSRRRSSLRRDSAQSSPVRAAFKQPTNCLDDGSVQMANCTQTTIEKDVLGGTCTVRLTMEFYITCPAQPPPYAAVVGA